MAAQEVFVNVIITLVAARVFGKILQRYYKLVLVGELLAGIILGPSILAIIGPGQDIVVLSELAVFFLMFLSGQDMDPEEIRKAGKSAIVISPIAFILPLIGGIGIFFVWNWKDSINIYWLNFVDNGGTCQRSNTDGIWHNSNQAWKYNNYSSHLNDIFSLVFLSIVLPVAIGDDDNDIGHVDYTEMGFSALRIGGFIGGVFLVDILFRKTSHWLSKWIEPN